MRHHTLKSAFLLAAVLVAQGSVIAPSTALSKDTALSKIVFHVAWYDVGKAALEGLPGVEKVTKGFSGFREINSVYYNSDLITQEEMITALKEAGTYIGILKAIH